VLTIALDRGWIVGVRDSLLGQSQEDEEEDRAIFQAHMEKIQQRRAEALQKAHEQRQNQYKRAADRLKQAQDYEHQMGAKLNATYKELVDSSYQLGEAKADLAKTKDEMDRLSNKTLELVRIRLSTDMPLTGFCRMPSWRFWMNPSITWAG
jgi:chromosome segregation ATPase